MSWKLRITDEAKKQLSKLDKGIQRTVSNYLRECAQLQDPASRGHALTGPWAGYHRYRVGQLRIVVSIERNEVTILVVTIDRRDTVYKSSA